MNRWLLIWTRDNLMSWITKADQESVPIQKLLTVTMMSLADMCSALARETEDEKIPGYREDEDED